MDNQTFHLLFDEFYSDVLDSVLSGSDARKDNTPARADIDGNNRHDCYFFYHWVNRVPHTLREKFKSELATTFHTANGKSDLKKPKDKQKREGWNSNLAERGITHFSQAKKVFELSARLNQVPVQQNLIGYIRYSRDDEGADLYAIRDNHQAIIEELEHRYPLQVELTNQPLSSVDTIDLDIEKIPKEIIHGWIDDKNVGNYTPESIRIKDFEKIFNSIIDIESYYSNEHDKSQKPVIKISGRKIECIPFGQEDFFEVIRTIVSDDKNTISGNFISVLNSYRTPCQHFLSMPAQRIPSESMQDILCASAQFSEKHLLALIRRILYYCEYQNLTLLGMIGSEKIIDSFIKIVDEYFKEDFEFFNIKSADEKTTQKPKNDLSFDSELDTEVYRDLLDSICNNVTYSSFKNTVSKSSHDYRKDWDGSVLFKFINAMPELTKKRFKELLEMKGISYITFRKGVTQGVSAKRAMDIFLLASEANNLSPEAYLMQYLSYCQNYGIKLDASVGHEKTIGRLLSKYTQN